MLDLKGGSWSVNRAGNQKGNMVGNMVIPVGNLITRAIIETRKKKMGRSTFKDDSLVTYVDIS